MINCRIRGLQRWGRRRGPGSQPGDSMLEQYCAGVLLESSRVNFTAPTQGGKKKKKRGSIPASHGDDIGRRFFSTPLRCLLQEKIIGPALGGSWRQTPFGAGGSPEDSFPAVCRGGP